VNRAQQSGMLCLALLLGLPAGAQRSPAGTPGLRPAAQFNPQKNPNRPNLNKGVRQPGPRLGDWLREHQNLAPDQQEKLLQSDPGFKRLPAERQAKMLENLRKFNSLPPQQQQRILNRMDFMESLTPQQREQIRQSQQTLQGLPQDRQIMIHKALRHLRQMDPQQRQEVLNSDRFKSMFSDQERGILGQLAAINPPEGEGPNPQQGPPGQQPK
jgi:hypothetical protein